MRTQSLVALAALVSIWGFYYLGIDILLESGWSPEFANALRFLAGGALLMLAVALKQDLRKAVVIQQRHPWKLLVVSLLGVGLGISLMTLGQVTVDSGLSGVLGSTTPLFAAGLGLFSVFAANAVGAKTWAGVGVGLCGIVLLYKPWGDQDVDLWGMTLLLAGAFCFALEANLIAKWFPSAELLPLTALTVVWAGLGFTAWVLISGDTSTGNWWVLIAMAALSNAFAYSCYLFLIRHRGPTFANLYAYLVPVVALVAGALLNNEQVGVALVLGALLCITGAILVGRDKATAVDH